MSGWFGYGKGEVSPLDEAYSRVTNAERFRPLHATMLEIIARLENDFDVERTEGHGLDEDLERRLALASPSVRLSPKDTDAAPITAVFTAFPGLHLRFGRWHMELFPNCGCDACDESADGEIERLTETVNDVIAGRFRETLRRPLTPFTGSGQTEAELWSAFKHRSTGSRLDRRRAREMSGGRRRLEMNWKPWPRRLLTGRIEVF